MEIIILGLLILKKSTVYEMRKVIEEKLSAMSSSSTGSIQATLKKLLKNGLVVYKEFVENSVNKKMYEITEKGKKYFINTVSKPMDYKEKNMEMGKFYNMGFTPKDIRCDLIDAYIAKLKKFKVKHEQIRSSIPGKELAVKGFVSYIKENNKIDYYKELIPSESLEEGIHDLALFQYAALEYAIEKANFEIKWFEKFKRQLEKGE